MEKPEPEAAGIDPRVAHAAGLIWKDGSWFVERTTPETFKRTEGRIQVRPFVAAPCYVGARDGATISTAPYESVRIEVSLSMPCYAAELEETAEFVQEWVAKRLLAERDEVVRSFAPQGRAG